MTASIGSCLNGGMTELYAGGDDARNGLETSSLAREARDSIVSIVAQKVKIRAKENNVSRLSQKSEMGVTYDLCALSDSLAR